MALRPPRSLWHDLWPVLLVVLLLVLSFVQALRSSNDLEIFWLRAWVPWAGGQYQAIYQPEHRGMGGYYYSPLFAWLGSPLGRLPWNIVRMLWAFLNLGLFVVLLREVRKCAGLHSWKDIPFLWWPIAGILVSGQFQTGQVSLLISVLTFLSLVWSTREEREIPAALLLALAIDIKIYPAFFLLYFLLTQRWKFLLSVAGFLVLFALAPAIVVGWTGNLNLLSLQGEVLSSVSLREDLGREPYQSLPAALLRFGRLLPGTIPAWSWTLLGQVLVAALGLSMWPVLKLPRQRLVGGLFILALVAQFSPTSWVHHVGFVYLPLLAWALVNKDALSVVARWGLVTFIVLFVGTNQALIGKSANDFFERLSLPTWAVLIWLLTFAHWLLADVRDRNGRRG